MQQFKHGLDIISGGDPRCSGTPVASAAATLVPTVRATTSGPSDVPDGGAATETPPKAPALLEGRSR